MGVDTKIYAHVGIWVKRDVEGGKKKGGGGGNMDINKELGREKR